MILDYCDHLPCDFYLMTDEQFADWRMGQDVDVVGMLCRGPESLPAKLTVPGAEGLPAIWNIVIAVTGGPADLDLKYGLRFLQDKPTGNRQTRELE